MNCLVVYNPVSGGSKKLIKLLPYIKKELLKQYDTVDIRPTNYAGEGTKIASEACGKYKVVIAAGGDGTLSDVLKGIGEHKNAPTLGYIPSGSCGDFAYNHHIPHGIKKALKIIIKGKKRNIDLCKINDSYFSYIAGIGTYTAGVYNTNQKLKMKIGRAAYFIQAFKETFDVKTYKLDLTIGKKVYHEDNVIMALVLNSRSVGGFTNFNYKAELDDGKVDVLLVKKSEFNSPVNIWKIVIQGIERAKDHPCVKVLSASNVSIKVDSEVIWNVDGDKSNYKDIDVKCIKKQITLFVGK